MISQYSYELHSFANLAVKTIMHFFLLKHANNITWAIILLLIQIGFGVNKKTEKQF